MPSILTQELKPIDTKDLDSAQVMGDYLLLRVYPKKAQSAGGLEIPEPAQEKRAAAWVIGVGKGAFSARTVQDPTATIGFLVGDTIVCPLAALCSLDEIGENVCYIRADDVILHWKAERCPKQGAPNDQSP